MSSRRPPDVFKTSCQDFFKTFSRRFEDVFKTSSRCLGKAPARHFEDVFKTSLRCIAKMSSIPFQDVLLIKLFLLTLLRDVFNTFLIRTAKTVIYRSNCLGHTAEKYMVSVQNLQE